LIISDLRAKASWNYGSEGSRAILKAMLTDGTAAMILYRFMQWSRHRGLVPLEMVFNKMNGLFCHCIIGRGAEFGPAFVLIHSQGVVINGAVRCGAGARIEHQVTIGAENHLSPSLGDDVFIGAGAKLIGGIKIGSHVRIGANAVVLCDVPSGTTAVGVPARIVARADSQEPKPHRETLGPRPVSAI
jgi:serine O-acetyltransferase